MRFVLLFLLASVCQAEVLERTQTLDQIAELLGKAMTPSQERGDKADLANVRTVRQLLLGLDGLIAHYKLKDSEIHYLLSKLALTEKNAGLSLIDSIRPSEIYLLRIRLEGRKPDRTELRAAKDLDIQDAVSAAKRLMNLDPSPENKAAYQKLLLQEYSNVPEVEFLDIVERTAKAEQDHFFGDDDGIPPGFDPNGGDDGCGEEWKKL